MLPYATPAIAATLDPHEERERDTLRTAVRQQLGSPAQAGARIALAICEVEAGLRSPLQLEQRCHLTLWPRLSARLRRSGGPAVPVGSLVRVVAQEHVPGPRSRCWCAGAGEWCRWPCGWMGPRAAGSWSSSSTDHSARVWRGPGRRPGPDPSLTDVAQTYPQTLSGGVVAAAGLVIVRP
jgi:hypothetical protein